jgi:CheY-like chemotaxis protein
METINEYRNVLIADDDQEDFELLSEAIDGLGQNMKIRRAENGNALLEMVQESAPDILFLDIEMPCRDGKSCIKTIRNNRDFDNLPIIVYTGNRDEELINFCFRNGINLYIHKPDSFSELVDIVQRVFATGGPTVQYYPKLADFVLNPSDFCHARMTCQRHVEPGLNEIGRENQMTLSKNLRPYHLDDLLDIDSSQSFNTALRFK